MARNKKLRDIQRERIQSRYEVLKKRYFKHPDYKAKCLLQLQKEFLLTYRSLDSIIHREYERVKPVTIDKNQLTIFDKVA